MEHQRDEPGNLCSRSHDLGSAYDWTLLGFAAAASIVFLLGNGVVFWNRKRRYFQFQGGAWLILGGSFGGLIWIVSSFAVNGHFKRQGLLGHCRLWKFWLQGTFGLPIWFSAITLRLNHISLLSNSRSSRNPVLLPAYHAISWILAAVVSTFATTRTLDYLFEPCNGGCILKPAPRVLTWVTLVAPYFIGNGYLLVRLRNVRKPRLAAEYSYTFEFFVMTCILMLLASVTFISEDDRKISGRCFVTFCQCCLVFCYFWVKLGRPIYLCVFKPDEMDNLEAELARSYAGSLDALEAVYRQRSMHVPSSEGAALERFTRAAEELETYKAQIRELEAKKAELLGLLELRQRRSSTIEPVRQNI